MATAVLDLDIERFPRTLIGFEGYDHGLALLRFRGRPIGQVRVSVAAGRIDVGELRERARLTASPAIWESLLHQALEWDERPATAFTLPTATIAVCTRDRPSDLERCLRSLGRLAQDGHEVLVVDNCPSTTATREVVARHPGVRYVLEERAGLDRARNRALREASGEIVAFCDDDAAPDPNWLQALLLNFDDPLVMCVTGLTMPIELESDAQEWFERYSPFGRGFQRMVFDSARLSPERAARVGAGANMALRRTLLDDLGPFDEALDAGTPACSGGDTDYFLRVLAAGYRIVYDPAALSWHRHRATWPELQRVLFGYGVGVYAAWTRHLVVEGELNVIRAGAGWLRYVQIPALIRSVFRRPGSTPLDLLLAELRGCAVGPLTYLLTRERSHS